MALNEELEEGLEEEKDFYLVGIDLGQVNDYTAIVIAKVGDQIGEHYSDRTLEVGQIERFPLRTPYPKQVKMIEAIYDNIEKQDATASLVIDSTGVGRAVTDLLEHLYPTRVNIHGGAEVHKVSYREYNVPKRDLVGAAQIALQIGRVKINPQLEHANTLKRELESFTTFITDSGKQTFENNPRVNPHDDLVLALSLICWELSTWTTPVDVISPTMGELIWE